MDRDRLSEVWLSTMGRYLEPPKVAEVLALPSKSHLAPTAGMKPSSTLLVTELMVHNPSAGSSSMRPGISMEALAWEAPSASAQPSKSHPQRPRPNSTASPEATTAPIHQQALRWMRTEIFSVRLLSAA